MKKKIDLGRKGGQNLRKFFKERGVSVTDIITLLDKKGYEKSLAAVQRKLYRWMNTEGLLKIGIDDFQRIMRLFNLSVFDYPYLPLQQGPFIEPAYENLVGFWTIYFTDVKGKVRTQNILLSECFENDKSDLRCTFFLGKKKSISIVDVNYFSRRLSFNHVEKDKFWFAGPAFFPFLFEGDNILPGFAFIISEGFAIGQVWVGVLEEEENLSKGEYILRSLRESSVTIDPDILGFRFFPKLKQPKEDYLFGGGIGPRE